MLGDMAERSIHTSGIHDPPPPTLVSGDFRCVTCSYALRGLSATGVCPECGTPVANALRNTLLESASPEYRRQLVKGLSLVTGGILVLIGAAFAAAGIGSMLQSSVGGNGVDALIAIILVAPQVMILAGYWLYSTPDPGYNGKDEPVRARVIIRVSTTVLATVIVLDLLASVASLQTSYFTRVLTVVSAIFSGLSIFIWIIHFLATMRYSRWVAERIPNPRWASRARTYAWLIPLLVLGPPLLLMSGALVLGISSTGSAGGPPPGLMAAGILGAFLGCFWVLALIATALMYWALLNRLRIEIRTIDQAKSAPPPTPPLTPPTSPPTSAAAGG